MSVNAAWHYIKDGNASPALSSAISSHRTGAAPSSDLELEVLRAYCSAQGLSTDFFGCDQNFDLTVYSSYGTTTLDNFISHISNCHVSWNDVVNGTYNTVQKLAAAIDRAAHWSVAYSEHQTVK